MEMLPPALKEIFMMIERDRRVIGHNIFDIDDIPAVYHYYIVISRLSSNFF